MIRKTKYFNPSDINIRPFKNKNKLFARIGSKSPSLFKLPVLFGFFSYLSLLFIQIIF